MHPLDALSSLVPASASSALGPGANVGSGGTDAQTLGRGKFAHLPEDECAICYESATTTLNIADEIQPHSTSDLSHSTAARRGEPPAYPLVTPYRTSCGHVYCYTCVAEKMIRAADEGGGPWECLRCGTPVLGA